MPGACKDPGWREPLQQGLDSCAGASTFGPNLIKTTTALPHSEDCLQLNVGPAICADRAPFLSWS